MCGCGIKFWREKFVGKFCCHRSQTTCASELQVYIVQKGSFKCNTNPSGQAGSTDRNGPVAGTHITSPIPTFDFRQRQAYDSAKSKALDSNPALVATIGPKKSSSGGEGFLSSLNPLGWGLGAEFFGLSTGRKVIHL